MKEKPLIIFDTDMDTDCDDAGALLMLINAHISGEITLAGVIADSMCEFAAPFCQKVLNYYGLKLPVGEIYGHIEPSNRFDAYIKHQKACTDVSYNRVLDLQSRSIYNSTELYLNLLREADDESVTILCVGMLTSVYEAMKSDPGLFAKKVKRFVLMGNPYKENDFNFSMDAYATKCFFESRQRPTFISYEGSNVITGNLLNTTLEENHPVRQAYEIWSHGHGRSSWDLIAALFAINPRLDVFKAVDTGLLTYNSQCKTAFIDKTATQDTVIGLSCTNDEMESILNNLLK